MLKHLRIVLSSSLIIAILSLIGYGAVEPRLAKAVTDQVVITLNVAQGISISAPADATMSTTLGVSANTAVATTTWNVITNDGSGYTLALQASTFPAMKSGSLFVLDYATGTPNLWNATSGSAYFGYSGFGTDTNTSTWGTDTKCYGASANAISTTLKYQGFQNGVNGTNIASRSATTTPSGIDTTVCYAVEQKSYFIPTSGPGNTAYTATITATATAS